MVIENFPLIDYKSFWKFINNLIFHCKIFSLPEKDVASAGLHNKSYDYPFLHTLDAQAGCHMECIA